MSSVSFQTKVLTVGVFLAMTGFTLVAPILPLYAREFGVSRTAAGALISTFAVARLVFDFVGGAGADRLGGRRIMVGGGALLAVASVGAALAPNYGVLVGARVLEGLGSAAFSTAAMQLIVVNTPKERLGRTMAFFQTGLLAGIAVGPVVGGFAAEIGDFSTPFWIYAVVGIGIAFLAYRFVEDAPTSASSVGDAYRAAGRLVARPTFLALLFVSFAIFLMRSGARITLLPLFAGEELGLTESRIGILLAISAAFTIVIINPGGSLVDRIGRRPVLVVGLLLTAVAIGAHGYVRSFGGLALLAVGYGLAAGLMGIPPPTLAGDLAEPGAEGATIGLYRMASDAGLVVGPLVMGGVVENDAFSTGFLIAAGLLVVAAAVSMLIREPTRSPVARSVAEEPA